MKISATVYAIDDEGAPRLFGWGVHLESTGDRGEDVIAITRALKMPFPVVISHQNGDAYTMEWPDCDIIARVQPVPANN